MADIRRVSPKEALDLLNDGFTYIDVRTEAEFAEGHPAGATNVPIALASPSGMAPNPYFLPVMEAAFAKDAKLVVGCKAGGRSLRAAQTLTAAGFANVVDQRGGWDGARDAFGQLAEQGWSRVGLPAEIGATEDRSYDALRKKLGIA